MSTYTTLASRGDPLSTNRRMSVFLYPNRSGTDNECENAITNGLTHAFDLLYDYGAIGYYEIAINYDHPGLPDDDKVTFKSEFAGWYEDQGYTATGAHMGVSGNFIGGRADAADCSGCTSWVTHRDCVTGVGGAKEEFKNTAIQEVLHTYIRYDLDSVSSMCEEDEHDLGTIYWDGAISPMATGYALSAPRQGDCKSQTEWTVYSTKLSSCTKKAVDYTGNTET